MSEPRWAAPHESPDAHVATLLRRPGAKTLALAGGQTPAPFFAALSGRGDIDWSQVTLLPTDDRCVAAEHPARNSAMLQRHFGQTAARILPLEPGMIVPPLDLAWLGVGLDGHVASLFPNLDPATDSAPGVIALTPDPLPTEAPYPRLSLSMATLASAADIIITIGGEAKLRVVAAALREGTLPVARLFRAAAGPVTIFRSA